MTSVTFDTSLGGDGTTVSDDTNPDTGLRNGGHRTRFVAALVQMVAMIGFVRTKASEAAASAASALNAPGTQSTSTTSNTIAASGDKTFTTQTGKLWAVGQPLVCASAASPGNQMNGYCKSYNSGTGALVITMTSSLGSGTFSDWVISLTGATGGVQPTRQVNGGGLVTGGGNLGADVALTVTKASAAEVAAGTNDTKAVTPKAIQDAMAPQTLTDAATVNWDWGAKKSAKVTLQGNRALGKPTNYLQGDVQQVEVWQDGTGSRTLAFNACYEFGEPGTPVQPTGAGKYGLLTARCIDADPVNPRFACSFIRYP